MSGMKPFTGNSESEILSSQIHGEMNDESKEWFLKASIKFQRLISNMICPQV